MLEKDFQKNLIKDIKKRLKGCVILKNDSGYIQGIPDLLILYNKRWAVLECKKTTNSIRQPNQEYWIDVLNNMSYAKFICPENKEVILDEVYRTLES